MVKPQIAQPIWFPTLVKACRDGNAEKVQRLLAGGHDKNEKDDDGRSALLHACWAGKIECGKLVIAAGAELENCVTDGMRPIHKAAMMEDGAGGPLVKCLIDAGADKEAMTRGGWFPLYIAAFSGFMDVAKVLVESGANIDQQSKQGMTALMAAIAGDQLEMVQYLLLQGPNTELQSKGRRTAMDVAEDRDKEHIIECLKNAAGPAG